MPALGFVRDELAEVGGRTRKRWTHDGKPRLDLRVGKRGVDLSLLSLPMISAGAFFGAPRPNQPQSKGAQNG
jgi:hypothetical protein